MNADAQDAPRVVIVYESMFGSTRLIAEAIAEGMRPTVPVTVVPIAAVGDFPGETDLLVVGGPTHAHGMSRPESRSDAVRWAANEQLDLQLDDAWHDTGIREWLKSSPPHVDHFAAFDTRVDMPRLFTGSAAAAIDRKLGKLGAHRLSDPRSFLVDRSSTLEPGEIDRARAWGAELAERLVPDPHA
ncbi:flavodoxin family protein [Microbacterium cremeum]|uniref:flavodoxin family protein n=1 Tax=Microbacterium cremeum TaxID=2782169 RepID=UPI0018894F88|nr:flavodoxin family protein [Microbacterium cremeum]